MGTAQSDVKGWDVGIFGCAVPAAQSRQRSGYTNGLSF